MLGGAVIASIDRYYPRILAVRVGRGWGKEAVIDRYYPLTVTTHESLPCVWGGDGARRARGKVLIQCSEEASLLQSQFMEWL